MKKLKKTIQILMIIISISLIFIFNNKVINADETEHQKGDLRCPQTISDGEKVHCNTISKNGKTVEVDMTYNLDTGDGGKIELTKSVKKADTLGHYLVQFKINGSNVPQRKTTSGRVNVVILFDRSDTMKNKALAKAKEAIIKFVSALTADNDNFYVSLIQFARKSSTSVWPTNEPFYSIPDPSIGMSSHLEKALKNTIYDWILGYCEDGKSDQNGCKTPGAKYVSVEGNDYIVLFGDGRYYVDYPDSSICDSDGKKYSSHNCTTRWRQYDKNGNGVHGNYSVEHYLNILDEMNVKRYAIHYDGKFSDPYDGNVRSYVKDCSGQKYSSCDKVYMGKFASNPNNVADAAGDRNLYESKFNEILEKIKTDVEENSSAIVGAISDKIGDEFYLTDASGRYQRFDIPLINENGYTSPEFEIEIDPYADPKAGIADGLEEYWHKTNENFTLTYTAEDGDLKTFTFKDNPEVYWIPNNLNINSCSDSALADTIRGEDDSDEYSFYSRVCYEGYTDEKNNYKNGYSVKIKVNNQKEGVTKFDLLSGLGFPSAIDISTNMICRYKFDVDKFNKEYQKIVNALNKAEIGSKDEASLTVQKTKYDDILENYRMLSQNIDLENYKNRFIEQPATLRVTYKNITGSDEISFANTNNIKTSINCTTIASSNINGKNVATDRTCYVSLSKSMELPKTCLSMQTGEQEECSNDEAQIEGNNKFYIKMKANSGEINVDVLKAGYRSNLDFHLKKVDEEGSCSFTTKNNGMGDIMFRQIELTDPFLKNYDRNRGVGRNYLNTKFDFEKVIDENTWNDSKEVEYEYLISKVNIEKIRKDTQEDVRKSYLGRNCYFTDSNEYQCSFTRNKTENGINNESQWFTKAEVLELD